MFLGLLGDLGLDRRALVHELNKLALPDWQIDWRNEQRLGINGTRAVVACQEQSRHRHWREIDTLLASCGLAEPASRLSRKIFRSLGEAEARVHGQALEEVHFHEVGALDAIIDISAAAVGLHLLGVQQLVSAPLPLNHGFVTAAHGRLPLPAPAVAALLEGHPVCHSPGDQELVTPTGAAIVVTAAEFSPLPRMRLEKVGYGVGSRDLVDRPNLLRGFLGTVDVETSLERDEISVLECNLDDANPEWLGQLQANLLQKGALDVSLAPLLMKKNRPGQLLTVLAKPEQEEELARLIMHQSSAIGVRCHRSLRFKLQRRPSQVTTPAGQVAVKLIYEGKTLLRVTPEFESCRTLAEATGLPLPEIYRLVAVAAAPLLERRSADQGTMPE
jgi:uncharacterized protein (TIGR00299 family) protein